MVLRSTVAAVRQFQARQGETCGVKGVEILDGFVDDSPSLAKTCLPRVVAERDGPRLVA